MSVLNNIFIEMNESFMRISKKYHDISIFQDFYLLLRRIAEKSQRLKCPGKTDCHDFSLIGHATISSLINNKMLYGTA